VKHIHPADRTQHLENAIEGSAHARILAVEVDLDGAQCGTGV